MERFETINDARANTGLQFSKVSKHKSLLLKETNKIRDIYIFESTSAPQFHGLVPAAGCQKRRRRVKRDRGNIVAVRRQSCHTSRRRVVGGQQPQFHGLVAAASCQQRRRRVKRARVATQVADELRKKWRRERTLAPSLWS